MEHCSDTPHELPDEEKGNGNLTVIVLPPTGYTRKQLGIKGRGLKSETRIEYSKHTPSKWSAHFQFILWVFSGDNWIKINALLSSDSGFHFHTA